MASPALASRRGSRHGRLYMATREHGGRFREGLTGRGVRSMGKGHEYRGVKYGRMWRYVCDVNCLVLTHLLRQLRPRTVQLWSGSFAGAAD